MLICSDPLEYMIILGYYIEMAHLASSRIVKSMEIVCNCVLGFITYVYASFRRLHVFSWKLICGSSRLIILYISMGGCRGASGPCTPPNCLTISPLKERGWSQMPADYSFPLPIVLSPPSLSKILGTQILKQTFTYCFTISYSRSLPLSLSLSLSWNRAFSHSKAKVISSPHSLS